MSDGSTLGAVESQQPGAVGLDNAQDVVNPRSHVSSGLEPVTTQVEVSPPSEAAVTPESLPLREKYAGLGARFRKLGKKQFESGLSSEELNEKQQLEEMASFGLLEQGLSDEQLKAKDAALQANLQAQGDLQQSAEEYRRLGRKLFNQGLVAEELERYNSLDALAKQGKFVLTQAA